MTGEVFQSDIEFAKRALAEGQNDQAIIAALGKRRVEPDRAAQLLEDLRSGRSINAAKPVVPRIRRSEQPGATGEQTRRGLPKVKPPGRRPDKYNRIASVIILITFLAAIAFIVIFVVMKKRTPEAGSMFEPSPAAVTNAQPAAP